MVGPVHKVLGAEPCNGTTSLVAATLLSDRFGPRRLLTPWHSVPKAPSALLLGDRQIVTLVTCPNDEELGNAMQIIAFSNLISEQRSSLQKL